MKIWICKVDMNEISLKYRSEEKPNEEFNCIELIL